ncbi:tetratricopeptide repeat protein [Candidatus Dependentiae bacterium]|nr:MAG: tetratricopeptide repeat protein [Candidatus Dependentiae bacterium]
MSLQNELKAFFYFFPRLIRDLWEHERNIARNYANMLAIIFLLMLGGAGAYFGYRWYAASREQNSQLALAEHVQELQKVVAGSKDLMSTQLAQLDASLSFDYRRHKSSATAPLFLLMQADVQIKQDRHVEAISTLQQVMNALPSTSPLRFLIKTKRALLQIDSKDDVTQQAGLQELMQLARDKENKQSDLALFYLGRYYWAHDKLDDAKTAWQELLNTPAYTQSFPSPWVYEAQEALTQMSL